MSNTNNDNNTNNNEAKRTLTAKTPNTTTTTTTAASSSGVVDRQTLAADLRNCSEDPEATPTDETARPRTQRGVDGICIGINAVTRAMERGNACHIIV
jgi:hypothetical protein